MNDAEVENIVSAVITKMKETAEKLNPGMVMKQLFQPGGPFEGKAVEKGGVAAAVKQILG